MSLDRIEERLIRRTLRSGKKECESHLYDDEQLKMHTKETEQLKKDWMVFFEETVKGFKDFRPIDKELHLAAHIMNAYIEKDEYE
jgi:hypothetical protein